jgi:hypothetical protein
MNVFKKLQEARVRLHSTSLNKSGKNNFAKFNYFELADFIPTVTKIFNDLGLCGIVSFNSTDAYLTIYNVDGEKDDFITFTSPLVMASMDRVQPIQSLGATHTYLRRYLWLMAMEIVENDAVDASAPAETASPIPTPIPTPKPKAEAPKAKVVTNMNDDGWTVTTEDVAKNMPAVILAVETLLEIAKSEEDLLTIFQKNKRVFDEMKEASKEQFEALMEKFSATKEKFKKE